MTLTFHRTLQPLSRLRHKVSAAFWLQSLACAVVAWSVMHGGITIAPPGAPPDGQSPPVAPDTIAPPGAFAPPAPDGASAPTAVAPSSAGAPGAPAPPSAIAVPAATGTLGATPDAQPPAAGARSASAPVPLSVVPTLAEARLALSTIDVTVTRNDTLDRIFRRLKLNLADLATLRGVPGLHAMLDSLRPGERLRFKHHDGEFLGLERRLNESHTLKVSRDPTGLKADVLQDTLETRSRTVRGVIDHSLFEAVEAAGARDQIAVALADIFGWDIDFALDVRSGDAFVVTWDEIWRDGTYLTYGPIEAAALVNQARALRAVRYTDPQGATRYYTPDGTSLQ